MILDFFFIITIYLFPFYLELIVGFLFFINFPILSPRPFSPGYAGTPADMTCQSDGLWSAAVGCFDADALVSSSSCGGGEYCKIDCTMGREYWKWENNVRKNIWKLLPGVWGYYIQDLFFVVVFFSLIFFWGGRCLGVWGKCLSIRYHILYMHWWMEAVFVVANTALLLVTVGWARRRTILFSRLDYYFFCGEGGDWRFNIIIHSSLPNTAVSSEEDVLEDSSSNTLPIILVIGAALAIMAGSQGGVILSLLRSNIVFKWIQ